MRSNLLLQERLESKWFSCCECSVKGEEPGAMLQKHDDVMIGWVIRLTNFTRRNVTFYVFLLGQAERSGGETGRINLFRRKSVARRWTWRDSGERVQWNPVRPSSKICKDSHPNPNNRSHTMQLLVLPLLLLLYIKFKVLFHEISSPPVLLSAVSFESMIVPQCSLRGQLKVETKYWGRAVS